MFNKTEKNSVETPNLLHEAAASLPHGLVVLDKAGAVVWSDQRLREQLDGQLKNLGELLTRDGQTWIACSFTSAEIEVAGSRISVCVLQEAEHPHDTSRDLVTAVQEVMADTSWLTQAMIEKMKAWCLAKRPSARASDIDILTEREREILALICEGCSDLEMSGRLKLSEHTVRNHVASLYRKIGVNRRGAAIIWARERALTSESFKLHKRHSPNVRREVRTNR
jgi:DNA-binding CsgD family transcriptional regulator